MPPPFLRPSVAVNSHQARNTNGTRRPKGEAPEKFSGGVKEWLRMGIFVASSPSSPRQVLSRCMRPAGVLKSSLTGQFADVVSPPIGLRKRCVPVASVASPVASALQTPKSALRGVFQNLKRAVWREKSTRLARLLPRSRLLPEVESTSSTAQVGCSGTPARVRSVLSQ